MNKSIRKLSRNLLLTASLLAPALNACALTINVTYDSSVTNIGTLSQVQTAFGAAVQTIKNLYTNNSTVNITVYSANAGPFGYIGLGESSFSYYTGFAYSDVKTALTAARTTAADTNSVASLPASDPTGGTEGWGIPLAEAKALESSGASLGVDPLGTSSDGDIGFATDVNYTFDPNNRAVPGEYDFIGVAEHELTEVMGRSSLILDSGAGYFPYDLFRFTSNGVRSFGPDDTGVYFSVNNGVTALKSFNPNNGGDIQDWATSTPHNSFDAYAASGFEGTLSAADLTALDIIGYKLNYKAPRLTGTALSNGRFQLNFTNTPGTSFTILVSTNLSLSVTNWTNLGTITETSAGQFQFTDTPAAGQPPRFYRVRLN